MIYGKASQLGNKENPPIRIPTNICTTQYAKTNNDFLPAVLTKEFQMA